MNRRNAIKAILGGMALAGVPTSLLAYIKHGGGLGTDMGLGIGGNPITWLLKDDFSVNVAAGSVNGSAVSPGPGGIRTANDTGSVLSVSGGKAIFAMASDWGDPGLWYAAQARIPGKILIAKINIGGFLRYAHFGWDSDQSGQIAPNPCFTFANDGNIYTTPGFANVGSYEVATDYYVAVVLKADGAYYFIKGGAFTVWTNLGDPSGGAETTPLYPGLSNHSMVNMLVDFIRIPRVIWTPSGTDYSILDAFIQ